MACPTRRRQAAATPENPAETIPHDDFPTALLWGHKHRLEIRSLQKQFQEVLVDINALREQLQIIQDDNAALRKEVAKLDISLTENMSSLLAALKEDKEARMQEDKRLEVAAELTQSRIDGLEVEIRRASLIADRTKTDLDEQSRTVQELESSVERLERVSDKDMHRDEFDKNARAAVSKLVTEKQGPNDSVSTSRGGAAAGGGFEKPEFKTQALDRGEGRSSPPPLLQKRIPKAPSVCLQVPAQEGKASVPVTAGQESRKRPVGESHFNSPHPKSRFVTPTIAPGERVPCYPPPTKRRVGRTISLWFD